MKIKQPVLEVLSKMTVGGRNAFLPPGQLDRKLYMDVNKVLSEMGGKWTRGAKAHVFASDPAALIDAAILTGEIGTAAEMGFFPTPTPIVKRMVALAGVTKNHLVLEPSAGDGAIVKELLSVGAKVTAVELSPDRAMSIDKRSALEPAVHVADFLATSPSDYVGPGNPDGMFDAVVMNPPFARGQDVAHVRHAFEFLKPGGMLCSVMSAGVTFRQDQKTSDFREWMQSLDGEIEKLPAGTFKPSGTDVSSIIVTIGKPAF